MEAHSGEGGVVGAYLVPRICCWVLWAESWHREEASRLKGPDTEAGIWE